MAGRPPVSRRAVRDVPVRWCDGSLIVRVDPYEGGYLRGNGELEHERAIFHTRIPADLVLEPSGREPARLYGGPA